MSTSCVGSWWQIGRCADGDPGSCRLIRAVRIFSAFQIKSCNRLSTRSLINTSIFHLLTLSLTSLYLWVGDSSLMELMRDRGDDLRLIRLKEKRKKKDHHRRDRRGWEREMKEEKLRREMKENETQRLWEGGYRLRTWVWFKETRSSTSQIKWNVFRYFLNLYLARLTVSKAASTSAVGFKDISRCRGAAYSTALWVLLHWAWLSRGAVTNKQLFGAFPWE